MCTFSEGAWVGNLCGEERGCGGEGRGEEGRVGRGVYCMYVCTWYGLEEGGELDVE